FQSVARRLLPMIGSGENTLSVVYAADAASACIRAVTADVPSGSRYFLDDGRVYVWKDMLSDVEAAIGKEALVRFGVPVPALRLAALLSETAGKATGKAVMLTRDKVNELSAPHWVCDGKDTRRALSWEPAVE